MRSLRLSLALAAGSAALAASSDANAQSSSPFATTDRPSADSFFGADLGFGFLDEAPLDDDQSLRVDLHGQYLLESGLGFYGMLPFSHLFLDGDDPDVAMGNLEGGAYFVAPLESFDLVLRGGIVMPTADGNAQGVTTNALASSVRVTDVALTFPDTTWLRLSASPILITGDVFFRTDIGVDAPVRTNIDVDPLFRINVAGGVRLDPVSLLGELAMVLNAEEAAAYAGDELMTGALTARFHGQTVEPGVSVLLPINDTLRDLIDVGLLLSLRFRL